MRAAGATRVVCIRTGLVLARDGGALPKMLPPFWFGAGGPVGSGRQYWPWIHLQDWVDLVRFAIRDPARRGSPERHGADAGDQRRLCPSPGPRASPAGLHADARDLR